MQDIIDAIGSNLWACVSLDENDQLKSHGVAPYSQIFDIRPDEQHAHFSLHFVNSLEEIREEMIYYRNWAATHEYDEPHFD